MCCFSAGRDVDLRVWGTRIFARGLAEGRQALVYQMGIAADAALAMILPLPVVAHAADDAVEFVSLEGYADFFADVQKLFPPPAAMGGFAPQSRAMAAPQKLVVHDVGKFEASFVPSPKDFDRLDERFRMPTGVFDRLPHYRDWGFAVFQLKSFGAKGIVDKVKRALGKETKEEEVHPMAFTFPRRDPSAIFFPTVHVHDGEVHEKAHFDHTLYVQHDSNLSKDGWWAGMSPSQGRLDVTKSKGLLDAATPMQSLGLQGSLPNRDTWIRAGAPIDAAA